MENWDHSPRTAPQTTPGKLLPPQPSHVGVFTTLFPATYTLNLIQNLPHFVTDMPFSTQKLLKSHRRRRGDLQMNSLRTAASLGGTSSPAGARAWGSFSPKAVTLLSA